MTGSDDVCVDSARRRICKCYNPLKSTHFIECCGDNIIRLEWTGATILYEQINDTSCTPSHRKSSCLVKGENNFRLNYEDKLKIYNSCSGKKRCNVSVKPSTNIKIQIPVTCEAASGSKINVSCHGYQKDTTETLNTLNSTENSKIVDEDEDKIFAFAFLGAICFVLIAIVCIRSGNGWTETNTKKELLNAGSNKGDSAQITNPNLTYKQVPVMDTNEVII
ncbi:hypothetical protein LOTGIDRAFT_162776 [Lottia gigantea]|uniref:Uncharacterized protein n=1 Tax=Lottia gigantea TaxID=225164 RepID=V4AAL4_LOTGI|nr:hypothetical protein LOTGIDRAFT_162776 [Lottia gigantea]ESO92125.1 hypothetical protein LOTGIDRAFT_162776 [Lottia gigantea]